MNKNRLYLDIHVIQTLPPSNVNRDDTGSPKTAIYGGVRRARVSSQSWKNVMRKYFLDESNEKLGIRSLDIVKYTAEQIKHIDSSIKDEDAKKKVKECLENAGIKTEHDKTKALIFFGQEQVNELANIIINEDCDKKVQDILSENIPIDIALFGRMVAGNQLLNVEASAQVAHAISTHAVQTEFDFYTAVDDLSAKDNAGAGMIGNIEYNSSTLYRYANIAIHDLMDQLKNKDKVIETSKLFIKAFANSVPTGKINTFANQTLPQMLMINIRRDRPVNLVTAYEEPIKFSNNGNVIESIKSLFSEMDKTEKFVEKPLATLYITSEKVSDVKCNEDLIEKKNIDELLSSFADIVLKEDLVVGRR